MARPTSTKTSSARVTTSATPDGVITAVVAVTGVTDQVEDLIMPGAFTRTLAIRRPKVVVHHSWDAFAGRVLHVEELMPNDPRLPKVQNDGRPWPASAGALVATMQFNLNVQAGRDAFEWARFYSQNNECEWSIGYKVVPGKTSKRRDGARVIYDLDVYEFSLVLFGAAKETMTLEVKGHPLVDGMETKRAAVRAAAGATLAAAMEAKALDGTGAGVSHAGMAVCANDTGRVLMLQRALSDDDPAAGTWEFPGGGLEDQDDSPLDGAHREWAEETGLNLPDGAQPWGSWTSPNGVYQLHIVVVPSESDLSLNPDHDNRDVTNPDDPKGKQPEQTAWFKPSDLPGMPSLRPEAQHTPWHMLHAATGRDEHGRKPATAKLEGKAADESSVNPADINYLRRVVLTATRQVTEAKAVLEQGKNPDVAAFATQRRQQAEAAIRKANTILLDVAAATVDPDQETPLFDQYDDRPGAYPAQYAVTEAKALNERAAAGKPRCRCGKPATKVLGWHGGEDLLCNTCPPAIRQ